MFALVLLSEPLTLLQVAGGVLIAAASCSRGGAAPPFAQRAFPSLSREVVHCAGDPLVGRRRTNAMDWWVWLLIVIAAVVLIGLIAGGRRRRAQQL